jgi:hypothetical protein
MLNEALTVVGRGGEGRGGVKMDMKNVTLVERRGEISLIAVT